MADPSSDTTPRMPVLSRAPLPALTSTSLLDRLRRLCTIAECRLELRSGETPLSDELAHHLSILEKWFDAPVSQSREPDGESLFGDDDANDDNDDNDDDDDDVDNTHNGGFSENVDTDKIQPPVDHASGKIFPLDPQSTSRTKDLSNKEPHKPVVVPISPPLSLQVDLYPPIIPHARSLRHGHTYPSLLVSDAACQTEAQGSDTDLLLERVMAASAKLKQNYENIVLFNDNLVARIDKFASDAMRQRTESDRLRHTVEFQRTELLCLKLQLEFYGSGLGTDAGVDPGLLSGVRKSPSAGGAGGEAGSSNGLNGLQMPTIHSGGGSTKASSPNISPVVPTTFVDHSSSAPRCLPTSAGRRLTMTGSRSSHTKNESTSAIGQSWAGPKGKRRESLRTYLNRNFSGPRPAIGAVRPSSGFVSRRTASVDNPNLPYLELPISGPLSALIRQAGLENDLKSPVRLAGIPAGSDESLPSPRLDQRNRLDEPSSLSSRDQAETGLDRDVTDEEELLFKELEDEPHRGDVSESITSGFSDRPDKKDLKGGDFRRHGRSESSDWWPNISPLRPADQERDVEDEIGVGKAGRGSGIEVIDELGDGTGVSGRSADGRGWLGDEGVEFDGEVGIKSEHSYVGGSSPPTFPADLPEPFYNLPDRDGIGRLDGSECTSLPGFGTQTGMTTPRVCVDSGSEGDDFRGEGMGSPPRWDCSNGRVGILYPSSPGSGRRAGLGDASMMVHPSSDGSNRPSGDGLDTGTPSPFWTVPAEGEDQSPSGSVLLNSDDEEYETEDESGESGESGDESEDGDCRRGSPPPTPFNRFVSSWLGLTGLGSDL